VNTDELAERITKLEKQAENTVTPALIACIGVIIAAVLAGIFALWGQYSNSRQQRELDRNKALFEQTEKILEFRIKQLEQFYAPMSACLRQSEALHSALQRQLAKDSPDRYILLDERDTDGNSMCVRNAAGAMYGFRLIDELPAIRGDKRAMVLVDRILAIGKEMTAIISEHAGLATEDLLPLLGEYEAHYAILSTIRGDDEAQALPPPATKEKGYYPYPRDLNTKVESGYRELGQFLDTYSDASKKMLKAVSLEFDNQSE